MDVIQNKSVEELLQSMLASTAKAQNECRCAQRDLKKMESRLDFNLLIIHDLLKRTD